MSYTSLSALRAIPVHQYFYTIKAKQYKLPEQGKVHEKTKQNKTTEKNKP